jgi:hypothetical protein
MKTHCLLLLAFLAGAFFAGATATPAEEPPTTKQELLERIEAAIRGGDKDALESLYNWEGVEEQKKATMGSMVQRLLEHELESAELAPSPAGGQSDRIVNGLRYKLNVEVRGGIKLTYATSAPAHMRVLSIPYGAVGDVYYLANTVVEKLDYDGPPDRTLNVSVMGETSPEPVAFKGVYVYEASGVEVKDRFTGAGNISKAFKGQHVKGCAVQKTGGDGWIEVVISEGGEKVFESGQVTSKEPIVYKRK